MNNVNDMLLTFKELNIYELEDIGVGKKCVAKSEFEKIKIFYENNACIKHRTCHIKDKKIILKEAKL